MLGEMQPLCELWEESPQAAIQHSRLYPVEPMGVGSPLVESLTSYIIRLSEEHSLHPRVLITDEILPFLQHSHLYRNNAPTYTHLTTFWKRSAILNGTSATTSGWVQALELLTGRGDLRFLTMFPWRQVLSPRGLLRSTQAWCQVCYEKWRAAARPIYQPLAWALEVTQVCPVHKVNLQTCCPYPGCSATLFPLTPKALQGYCPRCYRWLGKLPSPNEEASEKVEGALAWQYWINTAVGEMLENAPLLVGEPRQERFAATITAHIQQVMRGNLSLFARRLHVHRRTAWEWGQGQQVPQLASLLQVCAYFGKTPTRFFLEEPLESQLVHKQAKTCLQDKPRRHYRKFETEHILAALEAILQDESVPPPSMREVGRRLKYDASHLAKHFPAQCHAISAQFRAYQQASSITRQQQICRQVERLTRSLQAQGSSTSQRQIGKYFKTRGVFREQVVRTALTTMRQT